MKIRVHVLSEKQNKTKQTEKNEATKNFKRVVYHDLPFFYVACKRRVVRWGDILLRAVYDELRRFVTNYIHTIAFEENREERAYMMSIVRSKSIQG